MKENAEIEIQVDSAVSELEKTELTKKIKQQYGDNTTVVVKSKKIKNNLFEQNRANIINNNLTSVYQEYLTDNYPDVDQALFFQLDEKITKLVPDQNDDAKRFKVKWFGGKNILSFNDFQVNLEDRGILRVYSDPDNMGGKSNLIRCLKILLFGEFYRSNMERSTLGTIMNKFSPLNIAYVEGEIEIEEKIYYVRRDFTRNATGKVSQKITIGCEGAIIDTAYFEKMIGKIKDFLFISFFDSFSIEKWLNTKPTERYRMFLNYFGLGNIEEKAKIAKREYDAFLKASNSKQYFHLDLDTEINNLKSNVYFLEQQNTKFQDLLNQTDADLKQLDNELQRLQNQFKGVPDSLLNESKTTLTDKINTLLTNIQTKKQKIAELTNSIVEISETKEELSTIITDYQNKISQVSADKKLSAELETLNYLLLNFVIPAEQIQKKELQVKAIEDLRSKYVSLNSEIKFKEINLKNIPDTQTCENCGVVTNNGSKKSALKQEIENCKADLQKIADDGVNLKNDLSAIEQKIKQEEFNYKAEIKQKIANITATIEQGKQDQINEIRSKIFFTQKRLFQISDNESHEKEIEWLEKQIILDENSILELKHKLTVIDSYTQELNFNENLNASIVSKKSEIDTMVLTKNQYLVDIKFNEKQILEDKSKITHYEQVKLTIEDELKVDKLYKVYLDIHSKGGLAMKILNDLAQDINQDLSAILAHEDFVPYIKIEDDAIEFYFSRDNAEFNMAEGSGYEKTMLLLALHYLLLSKMVIPISNIFILDEVFVGVATGFLHRAYKVIESMLNMFDTILLITHVADIGEWCNDSIKVSKINNISKIVE